jgi:SAM-dependent methyltransferase
MSGDWWQEAFGADYLTLYAHRSDEQAAREVAGVLPRLRAAPGPVLDACCGNGRHLAALRAAGLCAIGFDWSGELLQVAAARAGARGRLFRGDVRQPACAGGFGAITLFFTAFGYFAEDGNQATLCALARLLAPGGWLLLDLPDPAVLRAGLVPRSERLIAQGRQVIEERRLDGPVVCKRVSILREGVCERSYEERVRLYEREELAALATAAGLQVDACWPGLAGPEDQAGRAVWWLRKEG